MDNKTLLEIYRRAVLIKLNDELMIKTMKSGKLAMPYYSPRGQEIIPAATMVSLREDDYLCTIYRGTHDMLAKGMPLKELWGELAGRATGTCKGKGGTMHVTYPKMGIMLTTGIVGSSMPIANGLGWASLLEKNGRVTIATFGDGASNIGAFHESLNLASIWKLPVVFLCQNNQYAEHTSLSACTSVERIADRAQAYSIPGVTVDGNDPDAMYAAAKEAIDRARAGEGPTLLEAVTFRFNGHLVGDDGSYIPQDEKAAAVAADPMPKLRARLVSEGIASEDQLSEMEAGITAEINAAIKAALEADYPAISELTTDVYASNA
jgi:acetoin:2,6-dichlorophenolindophenol oxidoreductase subunit alpha